MAAASSNTYKVTTGSGQVIYRTNEPGEGHTDSPTPPSSVTSVPQHQVTQAQYNQIQADIAAGRSVTPSEKAAVVAPGGSGWQKTGEGVWKYTGTNVPAGNAPPGAKALVVGGQVYESTKEGSYAFAGLTPEAFARGQAFPGQEQAAYHVTSPGGQKFRVSAGFGAKLMEAQKIEAQNQGLIDVWSAAPAPPSWSRPMERLAYDISNTENLLFTRKMQATPGSWQEAVATSELVALGFGTMLASPFFLVGGLLTNPVETIKNLNPATMINTYSEELQTNPDVAFGELLGFIAMPKIYKEAGRIGENIFSRVLERTSPDFIDLSKTGIRIVEGVTIPRTITELKSLELKEVPTIHTTYSSAFNLAPGEQIPIVAPTEIPTAGAGSARLAYELYGLYQSAPLERGIFKMDYASGNWYQVQYNPNIMPFAQPYEPLLYGGYVGLGEGYEGLSTIKLAFFKPKVTAVILRENLISITPRTISREGIFKTNIWQQLQSGKTFLAPENIAKGKFSTEGQVITTAKFTSRITGKEYPGSIFEATEGELTGKFSYYRQREPLPEFITGKLGIATWNILTEKTIKINWIEGKIMPVENIAAEAIRPNVKTLDIQKYSESYGKETYITSSSIIRHSSVFSFPSEISSPISSKVSSSSMKSSASSISSTYYSSGAYYSSLSYRSSLSSISSMSNLSSLISSSSLSSSMKSSYSYPRSITTTTSIPIISQPSFGTKIKGTKLKTFKRGYLYTPSLTAQYFKFKAKKMPKYATSGLAIRPMLKSRIRLGAF